LTRAWRTLEDIRKEGKVRHIGVSNFTVADLEAASDVAPVTSLQPPYSALRRDIEQDVLPWCQAHGVGVIVYSPMQSGLLTGAMTRERFASLADERLAPESEVLPGALFHAGARAGRASAAPWGRSTASRRAKPPSRGR
jgi:aryl-alcohol dehydrogenase-like predicted oxidoreductase